LVSRQNLTVAAVLLVVVSVLGAFALRPVPEVKPKEGPFTIIRPPSDVTCMVPLGDALWVGGKLGILGISIDDHQTIDFPYDVKLSYVRHMILDGGSLLVGDDAGLTVFTGSAYETIRAVDGLIDGRVNYLLRSSGGELWVGTAQGAYHSSGDTWLRVTKADGLRER
jgi:hypothetical protein